MRNVYGSARMMAARLGMVTVMLIPAVSQATSVNLTPLMLTFAPGQKAAQIILRNDGLQPVSMQTRIFAWSHDPANGTLLAPAPDITAGPALITVQPGATQIIRVIRRTSTTPGEERYYRVLVDELPDAAAVARANVNILTRYSLPVFVEPALVGVPRLTGSLIRCDDSHGIVAITNSGKRRARIANWVLSAPSHARIDAHDGLAGYSLAGNSLRLPVNLPATGSEPDAGLTLSMATDQGQTDLSLAVSEDKTACASGT